jgi:hypothetical protein
MIAYVSLAAWAAVLFAISFEAIRYLRGHYTALGSWKLAVKLMAMTWLVSIVQREFLPERTDMRTGVLAFSTLVACYILILIWQDRRGQHR